ncbi:MATE family efflux transporter [Proteinivorax hydrogeniformans]|uniref:MATE family efflux transporter n=1 Tax=Proteinivorax hydrogeniformans TaxID=1826727 RepID=A0AAU8HS96_9FIRM
MTGGNSIKVKNSSRLGTDPILPLLFKLSLPGIVAMGVQAFYNVVDSYFVAQISEEAIAALSIAFPLHILLIALAVGTGVGTSSLISRMLGKDDNDKAVAVAEHVIIISIIYGALIFLLGLFFPQSFINLFTTDPLISAYAMQYIRVILIGSLPLFLSFLTSDILRGQGNTFTPMLAMIAGAVTNILLDPILIFGLGPIPSLEVLGAAIATVISKMVTCAIVVYILFKGKNEVQPRFKNKFKFDKSIVKNIYAVGLPATVMQMLASIMIVGINMIVGGINELGLAATGIYFRVQSFIFMPVFGVSQGYIPLVGYNFSNGDIKRVKKTIFYGLAAGFFFTFLGFVAFQLFPHLIVRPFVDNKELMTITTTAFKNISIAFPIIGPAIIGATTFQAIGRGIPSLTLSFLRQIVLLLPIAYLLSFTGSISAVWYAFPISEFLTSILMVTWLTTTLKKEFAHIRAKVKQ